MPLKGRNLFTFRFLWHANKKRLPYRFLLADGQVNDAVAQRLEDSRKYFPELDIEYVRYPDDSDYSRFFTKLSDAMQRVRTPYVMLADNDDFLGFDGIEKALDFLDARADYVCARGHQMGFSLYSGMSAVPGSISGRFNQFYLDPDHKEFDAPSAAQRLRQGGLCHRLHYAIWRTAAPLCIMREIAEINFFDLMLYEDFFALRALTFGKAHLSNETISYYSQAGTGVSYTPMRDWASHLRQSRFKSGSDAIVARISSATAAADGVDAATVAEDVRTILENYYQSILKANDRVAARVKRALRDQWPGLAMYMQARPRLGAARERAAMLSQLKDAGATERALGCVRDELAEVGSALSQEALTDFAGPFLPMAQACGDRVWV
jgi:glycosyltransferase domain-containing protein